METQVRTAYNANNEGSQKGPMSSTDNVFRTSTIVIGGGQSGLAVGYYLKKMNIPFLILDANHRTGDSWRKRWDSLRLFTPARYNGLPGVRFPAASHYFPTKDEMAIFLEDYATSFELPIRHDISVDSLTSENGTFVIKSGDKTFEADQVVVAMATYQQPKPPVFADALDPDIVQFHSNVYRNPDQLQEGDVLLVGAGNSASEIAMELSPKHKVYMSGRDTGHVPFRVNTRLARWLLMPLVLKVLFHRIFTVDTPIGRIVRKKVLTKGGPLIRVKPKDLAAAGVVRVGNTTGVQNGKPVLADGTVLNVKNVIWCSGFHADFSWIKLPVMGKDEPEHRAGIVPSVPGLYFMGLHFLYSFSSTMVHGADRDAKRIVNHLLQRVRLAG